MADTPVPRPDGDAKPELKPEMPAVQPVPAPTPSPTPKLDPGAPKVTPAGDGNVFTELFGAAEGNGDSKLMDRVIEQGSKAKEGFKLFKKAKPKKETKKTSSVSSSSGAKKPGNSLLKASVLLLVLVGAFFYTQNRAEFTLLGSNPAADVISAENRVETLQAEIIFQKHLSAVLVLEQFSVQADEYFYSQEQVRSDFVSSNKKADYQEEAAALRPQLVNLVKAMQILLKEQPSPDLLSVAVGQADRLIAEANSGKASFEQEQELLDFSNARRLLQSKAFKDLIRALDSEDLSDQDLLSVFEGYNEINQSVSSFVAQVQAERQSWSDVLSEVERVTKQIDPLFGTEYEGNIRIIDIKLGPDQTVTVTGNTLTSDSKNFTLVSNLIDAYAASDFFSKAEDRSYNKNAADESFTGAFRIQLTLAQ